jgi:hypothetical protein
MTIRAKSLVAVAVLCAVTSLAGLAVAATPASIKVSGQKITGEEVTIVEVNLPRDGFLVIYPSDANGNLIERPIGEVALSAGNHNAVKVHLTEQHETGDKLWATLHEDTRVRAYYGFGVPGQTIIGMPMKVDGRIVARSFKVE